jgi:hypothetical protein
VLACLLNIKTGKMVSSKYKKVYNPDEILMGQAGSGGERA